MGKGKPILPTRGKPVAATPSYTALAEASPGKASTYAKDAKMVAPAKAAAKKGATASARVGVGSKPASPVRRQASEDAPDPSSFFEPPPDAADFFKPPTPSISGKSRGWGDLIGAMLLVSLNNEGSCKCILTFIARE